MSNQRPFFARFLEALLDSRNKVTGNVVADGAVLKLEAGFLDLIGAFGQRLKASNDLTGAGRDARPETRDG